MGVTVQKSRGGALGATFWIRFKPRVTTPFHNSIQVLEWRRQTSVWQSVGTKGGVLFDCRYLCGGK
jgi:hypothetical protein